jgi:Rad3-related DNA helicase
VSSILDGLVPGDLSLPAKFEEYREIQREGVDFALYGPEGDGREVRRWMAMGMPGGSGKSVLAHSIAALNGVKTVILTATRGLENQQVDDKFRMVNVRGKANYECLDYDPLHPERKWSCEEGYDHDCSMADTDMCTYTGRVAQARAARVVLTNMSYWMHARANNRAALETGREPVEMLIVDEGHLIAGLLAAFLGTWVSNANLHRYANKEIREVVRATGGAESGRLGPTWTAALGKVANGVIGRMALIAEKYKSEAQAARQSGEYRTLDKLSRNLARVLLHAEGEAEEEGQRKGNKQPNWLWRMTRDGIAFDCVWPGRYAERYLWSGVPNIVLMSASLRPKALRLCGVGERESWFKEWPSVFPVGDWPVYWIPTGRMGYKTPAEEKEISIRRVDEICSEWREYKGIIHTASYERAEWYQSKCEWGRQMILSKPGGQVEAAEKYKRTPAPCLLVSPSFTTGFDFPEEDVGFQIIPKLPFPDRSDVVMLARCEDDRDYYTYVTANTLVQACMRKIRRPGQKSYTFITDDAVGNFRRYASGHMPRYFRVRDSKLVPPAPKK